MGLGGGRRFRCASASAGRGGCPLPAREGAARDAARRFLDGLRAEARGKGSLFADGVVSLPARSAQAPAGSACQIKEKT